MRAAGPGEHQGETQCSGLYQHSGNQDVDKFPFYVNKACYLLINSPNRYLSHQSSSQTTVAVHYCPACVKVKSDRKGIKKQESCDSSRESTCLLYLLLKLWYRSAWWNGRTQIQAALPNVEAKLPRFRKWQRYVRNTWVMTKCWYNLQALIQRNCSFTGNY